MDDLHLMVRLLLGSLTAVDLLACPSILDHDSAHASLASVLHLNDHLPVALLAHDVAFCEVRRQGEDVSKLPHRLI